MAIQASLTYKSIPIQDAYISIMQIAGGKMYGNWSGRVGVFANSSLARIREILVKQAVPAVPPIPAIPATAENPSVPEVPGIPEQPAEYQYLQPDPIFTFDISVPYSPTELNPYVLIYNKVKELSDLTNVMDV